jgi:DNA-binding MltR family transcriptional regulator
MREVEDPISNAVTTHLLVEYGLNLLLQEEASSHDEVVEELQSNYPIAKAKLLWKIKVIPKELYDNIHKLNKIRNYLTHDLNHDFRNVDLNFYNYKNGGIGDVDVSAFKKSFSSPPTRG